MNRPTKVLIVEDNRDMQQLLKQLLADEYDCILANHGAEAWALLEAENTAVQDIELILSDVMMPEMDGYTLLEKIKVPSALAETAGYHADCPGSGRRQTPCPPDGRRRLPAQALLPEELLAS